ncbi:helix-turn-helix domain-containing protein [Planobispora rosea]|nr:helix-turn-helix transcriptional regulator [Planobispora rosea]
MRYRAVVPRSPIDPHADAVVLRRQAFGRRLRALREEAKLTQAAVAAAAGLDRSFYVGVEAGKRNISLDNVFAIADALGVPVEALFAGLPQALDPAAQ